QPEPRQIRTRNPWESDLEIPDRAAILAWGREQARLEQAAAAAAEAVNAANAAPAALPAPAAGAAPRALAARIAVYDGPAGSIARAHAEVVARDAVAQQLAQPIPDLRRAQTQAQATLDARRADLTAIMRELWANATESVA